MIERSLHLTIDPLMHMAGHFCRVGELLGGRAGVFWASAASARKTRTSNLLT